MNEERDEEQQLLVRLNEEEGIGDKIGDGDVTFVLTLSVFTAVCGSFFCGCSVSLCLSSYFFKFKKKNSDFCRPYGCLISLQISNLHGSL